MDVDVLYRDFLVSLAAMAIQSLEQGCVGAGQLVGLIEALLFAFKGLACQHGPAIAFHRGIVCGQKLGRYHSFELVFGAHARQRFDSGAALPSQGGFVGLGDPKRVEGLVRKHVVPVIGLIAPLPPLSRAMGEMALAVWRFSSVGACLPKLTRPLVWGRFCTCLITSPFAPVRATSVGQAAVAGMRGPAS
jgi:hypothetical protein